MEKTFVAAREDRPGPAWLERFRAGREEAERWYLGDLHIVAFVCLMLKKAALLQAGS